MTTRDIQAHIKDLYGYDISPETVSSITDKVIDRAQEWQGRPLESIFALIYMDAVFLKMKMEGHVRNVALDSIIGINLDGQKECLGLWISETESAKYWVSVLNELNNRGVQDVLIFTVDNLKGISEAIQAVHESGVRGHIKEPQHPGQYGRPGTGLRQHFRRAILAIGQVRRSVSS